MNEYFVKYKKTEPSPRRWEVEKAEIVLADTAQSAVEKLGKDITLIDIHKI